MKKTFILALIAYDGSQKISFEHILLIFSLMEKAHRVHLFIYYSAYRTCIYKSEVNKFIKKTAILTESTAASTR